MTLGVSDNCEGVRIEEWTQCRLGHVADINPRGWVGKSDSLGDGQVVFLPMPAVGVSGQLRTDLRMSKGALTAGLTRFSRGDILVAKITPCFENGKGASLDRLPTQHGAGSSEFHVLRPRATINVRFLYRLTTEKVFRLNGEQMMTGSAGQKRVPTSYLKETVIFLPSMEEQELIVRYLDHAELRIAKAIAAKQCMIKLLDEREELALLQAITQSDKPKTTDPRLDWLGEFPAHWDVKRLGSLLEERNEMNADRQVQQVLSLVRKRGVMRYEDKGRIGNKRSDDVARYKVVREGDIVLNSMNVIIGSVGQSAYTGCLSPVYYVLKPRSNEHHNAYFNALFQVERFHSSLVRFGKGILAHRMRIPMIDLKTVMLPVPPPDEQLAIADRVVKATAELRAAKAGIEAEIALLKEYRTRLISDVVTGKLDVRDEAAKLPDVDPMELATTAVGENGDDEEATDDD
jgi:restriction endonuclease S subunit